MYSSVLGHVGPWPLRNTTCSPEIANHCLVTNMPLTGWTVGWVENPGSLECRRPSVPPPVIAHFGPITPKC